MIKYFPIFILLIFSVTVCSQLNITDTKLAYEYYRTKEYDKAIIIYKNLYESSNSRSYLVFYLNCLIELQEFDNATKLIRQQMKKHPDELAFNIDMGYIFKRMGKEDEAKKSYENAIEDLPANENQVQLVAMAFREKYENEYAEKTYLKGRELLRNKKCFRNDLANVYMLERKYDEMIGEYLDMLEDNEVNMVNVQSRLQSAMFMDIDDNLQTIIKQGILRRIQQNPDKSSFNELLIWLYIQEKEFDQAFIQAKAIDKRNNEVGQRVISLARLAASNEYYQDALAMYRYVISKGRNSENYFNARREYLGTQFKQLLSEPDAPVDSIIQLEKDYESAVAEFGKNAQMVSVNREIAHIKAFYLNQPDEAVSLLNEAIKVQGVNSFVLADLKLELADIELLSGNIWEAALIYGQVEKSNENNPTGHEAKFRKARLAYYAGDFKWAQAQLDVLKASTSKLIANDACELSLLISDNTEMDTSEAALCLYARADLLSYQNKDSLAILTLDSMLKMYPAHSLTDEAYFKKANIFYKLKKYEDARDCYQVIAEHYNFDILGDDALYQLALLYEKRFNDSQKAMELYKEFLTNYPGSIYVVDVRKKYRQLRGDEI